MAAGFSLLCVVFLQFWQVRTALRSSPRASHGARWLPPLVAGHRLWDTWARELRLGVSSTGSIAVVHPFSCSSDVGSSRIRDQTDVHATAGRFLSSVPLEKSHLILKNLRSRYPNPHFTGEETEASVIE